MDKKKQTFLLVFLVLFFGAINYNFIDGQLKNFLDDSDVKIVERVIDGDTIVVENNTHVRLLGINTPEKKELYHDEAMNFLSGLILNKTIKLEYGKEKKDRYGRVLAYAILDGKNINLEQVKNGFANYYIYDNDEYTTKLKDAWNECLVSGKNLCEKSRDKCSDCVELRELNIKEQEVIFYNKCNFECDLTKWNIKDEGRKNFIFPNFILKENSEVKIIVGNKTNSDGILYWNEKDYVWTTGGDTLFLRDDAGRLVRWSSY